MPWDILVAILTPLLASATVPPPDFNSWSAKEKVKWVNSNLDLGSGGSDLPAPWWLENRGLHCFNLECIYRGGQLDRADVVSPYQCRMLGAHPDGIVAWMKAVWEPDAQNYTGIFKKDADHGFFRIGFQGYPEDVVKVIMQVDNCTQTGCNASDFVNISAPPNAMMFMGLKFYRDNVPSANIHLAGMADLVGGSWSLFTKMYTNMISGVGVPENDTTANPFEALSQQAAMRGTKWPGFNGMVDFGMYDQDGHLEPDAKFPYQLLLVPTNKTIEALPRECIGGIDKSVKKMRETIGIGDAIWDIYLKDTLLAPMKKVGSIQLTSPLMLSADTDRQGFFPHSRFDHDVEMRPEFTSDEELGCKDYYHCFACPMVPAFCNPTPDIVRIWAGFRANNSAWRELAGRRTTAIESSHELLESKKTLTIGEHTFGPVKNAQGASCLFAHQSNRSGMLASDVNAPREALNETTPGDYMYKAPDPPRTDDIAIDPLTGYAFHKFSVCPEHQCDKCWPRSPRGPPFSTSCNKTRVKGRYPSELEYAIDEDCPDERLPRCDKGDGTWYSTIYPCKCGSTTCWTGQLCDESSSSCISWGPFAQASMRTEFRKRFAMACGSPSIV